VAAESTVHLSKHGPLPGKDNIAAYTTTRRYLGNMGGYIFCIFVLYWKLILYDQYTCNMHTSYAY